MIKAVIFDVDGTLVDSVDAHAHAWQDVFQEFGHDIGFDAVRQQIGKGGDQLMPVFLSQDELDARGEDIEKRRSDILKTSYLPHIKAFPDVRALFQRLRGDGITTVLASSAKAAELEVYKAIADITALVDEQTTADDVEKSKPHPDIFQAAMQRLPGLPLDQAIVIGDSPYDAEAAAKAGLRTIGFLSGGFPEAALRHAGCVAIYRGPRHLLQDYSRSMLASAGSKA